MTLLARNLERYRGFSKLITTKVIQKDKLNGKNSPHIIVQQFIEFVCYKELKIQLLALLIFYIGHPY